MQRTKYFLGKVGVGVILCISLVCASSCSKKEPSGSATPPAKPKADTSQAKTEAPTGAGELVPLPITLPKPMFVGTPTNFEGVMDIEPPLGKARPPFLAPKGATNLALGKPVTSSVAEPIIGQLAWITDGSKEASDAGLVELDPFLQHVTIDLGQPCEIYAVLVWHYHKQSRVYFDMVVQAADDPDFITNVRTLFNNDKDNTSGLGVGTDRQYVETSEGKLIDAKGVKARYVRLYSKGNNSNDQSHYLEVEVYGKPMP